MCFKEENMTYRILSLDGGGIRGVITASLMERLETIHPGWLRQVNLIAGTSTGGILALALASGLSPQEARNLYERLGDKVFHVSLWERFTDLGQIRGAKYRNDVLKDELFTTFGNKTLADLPKKVLISTFDLDNEDPYPEKRSWKPKYLHNFEGKGSDGHVPVVDAALRTSAAPTFFPIYQGFVDGGVVSNNPAMCAVAQALEPKSGKRRLHEIRLLSIGTGRNRKFMVNKEDEEWGLAQWAPHLVSLMLEGAMGVADFQCRQILGKRYLRLDPVLTEEIGLDGVDKIETMRILASQYDLSAAIPWLKCNFV